MLEMSFRVFSICMDGTLPHPAIEEMLVTIVFRK